jgi:hypothetical protein
MENLEERLESLRHGVGNMQHGLSGDEDYYTAAEVIDAALAELRRHRMTPQERALVAEAADEPIWLLDDTGRTIRDYLARTAPKGQSNG